MDAATIRIVVEADAAGVGQGLGTAEQQVKSFGQRVGDTLKSVGQAAAGLAIGANIISHAGLATGLRSLGLFQNEVTSKLAKIGNAFAAVSIASKGLLVAGAGLGLLAVGLGLALGPAIAFESAMAGVKKTVDGTPAQLAAIGEGLREMSTRLPGTAAALADVAANAGQLGVAANNVLLFTETVATLAATTDLTLDSASETLAQFFNITGGNLATELTGVADVIVTLGNNLATTESQILSFATRIAGAGTLVGLDEGEILAIAAAYSSLGLEAEAGGTAVSQVLREMSDAALSGSANLEVFAEVAGLLPDAFAALVQNDPAAALLAFEQGLGNIIASGGNVLPILNQLGLDGIRVSDALLRGALNSELLADALGLTDGALSNTGAAAAELGVRLETTSTRLELFKDRLTNIAIGVGTPLLSTFAAAVDGIGDAIERVVQIIGPATAEIFEFFSNGAQVTGEFVAAIGSPVLAAAAGILVVLATAAEGFFGALNAGNPVVITLTAAILAYNVQAVVAAVASTTLGTAIGVVALNTGAAIAGVLGLSTASGVLNKALAVGPLLAVGAALAVIGDSMLNASQRAREVQSAFEDAFSNSISTGNFEALRQQVDLASDGIDRLKDSQQQARESGFTLANASQRATDVLGFLGFASNDTAAAIEGLQAALDDSGAEQFVRRLDALVEGVGQVGPAFEISADAALEFAVANGLVQDLISDDPAKYGPAQDALRAYNDTQVELANSVGITVAELDAASTALDRASAAFDELGESASAAANQIKAFEDPAIAATLSVIELDAAVASFQAQADEGFGSIQEEFVAANDLGQQFLTTMVELAEAGQLDEVSFQNLQTEFEGIISQGNLADETIQQLSESFFSLANEQILLQLDADADEAQRKIDTAREDIEKLGGTVYTATIDLEDGDFRSILTDTLIDLEAIDGATATAFVAADTTLARQEIGAALQDLGVWEESEATAFLSADTGEANAMIAAALVELGVWDGATAIATLGADDEATDVLLEALGLAEDFDSTEAEAAAYMEVFGLENIQLALDMMALLQNKTVSIGFNVGRVGGGGDFSGTGDQVASGSTNIAHGAVLYYASGDIANGHQPEITRQGAATRIWSEPETQGEIYAPLANDWRRPRARNIMREGARRLGMGPADFFAGGGITGFAPGGVNFATQIGLPTISVQVSVDAESLGQVGIDLAPVVDTLNAIGIAATSSVDGVSSVGEALMGSAQLGEAFTIVIGGSSDALRGWGTSLDVAKLAIEGLGDGTADMRDLFIDATDDMIEAAAAAGQEIVEAMDPSEIITLFEEAGVGSREALEEAFAEAGENVGQFIDDLAEQGADLEDVFVDVFTNSASASELLVTALSGASEALDDVSDAMGRAKDIGEILGGTYLDLIDAENDYLDALDEVNESIADQEESFDRSTEAGRDNYDALIDLGEAMADLALATAESGVSADEAVAKYEELKTQFIELATQAGLSQEEIDLLVEALFAIPPEVIAEIAVEAEEANAAIDEIDEKLTELQEREAIETEIKVEIEEALARIQEIDDLLAVVTDEEHIATLKAERQELVDAIEQSLTDLQALADTETVAVIGADNSEAIKSIGEAQRAAAEYAKASYDASIDATDNASGPIVVVQNLIDGYTAGTYNPSIDATDNASAVIAVPQGNANAFVGSSPYNGVVTVTDNASGTLKTIIGLANDAARPRVGTVTINTNNNTINTVTNRTVTIPGQTGVALQNAGGILAFANGGLTAQEDHRAQIVPAGTYRMFGEWESGGEGYIPLANDWRRPRAESILGTIARQFGGEYVKAFADGGMTTSPSMSLSAVNSSSGQRNLNIGSGAFTFQIDGSQDPMETARTVRKVVDQALDDFARDLDSEFSRR